VQENEASFSDAYAHVVGGFTEPVIIGDEKAPFVLSAGNGGRSGNQAHAGIAASVHPVGGKFGAGAKESLVITGPEDAVPGTHEEAVGNGKSAARLDEKKFPLLFAAAEAIEILCPDVALCVVGREAYQQMTAAGITADADGAEGKS